MSLSFLNSAVSSVNWWLVAQYGLEATTLALTTWLATSKPVDHSVTPSAVAPSSPPRRKTRKSEAHMSKQKAEPQLRRSARLRKETPVETLPQAPKKKVTFNDLIRVEYVEMWYNDTWPKERKYPKYRVDYDGDVIME